MCGVFGFVAKDRKPVDLAILSRVARVTMSRGTHAWGMAWIDKKGRLKMYKQEGRIVDSLGLLSMARNASMVIGHCRHATHGDPQDNSNNHPHPAEDGWIVHNGVITRYRRIIAQYELEPVTQCDSEVLGLLIDSLPGPIAKRCAKAAQIAAGGPLVMLGLWADRLIAIRDGWQPLHLGETRDGDYIASLPDELPGQVSQVENGYLLEWKGTNVSAQS